MRLPRYDKSSLAMKREVVTAGDTVYAAGQIASDYRTGVPPEARQDPLAVHGCRVGIDLTAVLP